MASELTITIRGPQGAGKTALAQALDELLTAYRVSVVLKNEDQTDPDYWDGLDALRRLAREPGLCVEIVTETVP